MGSTTEFAAQIRERFPEGLTACIIIGGTRTAYILSQQRHLDDPGRIRDFTHYSQTMTQEYIRLATDFYNLGGQNLLINLFGYQAFSARGEAYTAQAIQQTYVLMQEPFLSFYRQQQVDPYFVGVDAMLALPAETAIHQFGLALQQFQSQWPYQPGHRKWLWEIAVVQQYSFWQVRDRLSPHEVQTLDAAIAHPPDFNTLNDPLYEAFCRACYGTVIPTPHFYIGNNRKGTLKLRTIFPAAFANARAMKMYFTPYPTTFLRERELRAIIQDVAFGSSQRTTQQFDYSAQYTASQAQAEYERFVHLRDDLGSIVGFSTPPVGFDSAADDTD
jgi:hypothetical protein